MTQYVSDTPQYITNTDQGLSWQTCIPSPLQSVVKSTSDKSFFVLEGGLYKIDVSVSTKGDVNSNASIHIRIDVNDTIQSSIIRTIGFTGDASLRYDMSHVLVLHQYDRVEIFAVALYTEVDSLSPEENSINTLKFTKMS